MKLKDYLRQMAQRDASDLFYRAGGCVYLRIYGKVLPVSNKILTLDDVNEAVNELTTASQREALQKNKDIDIGIYLEEFKQRFRVSIFMQRNTPSIVIRQIRQDIKPFRELGLPQDVLENLCKQTRGLVLLTGATGSGKSTTIASMIEYINSNSKKHILTIEEPIEFTFSDKECVINQREIGKDVSGYAQALRAFALQSPDVIFIGNIRDYETMSTALIAAETGVLVLSTLHTVNAAQTVERIINFFPPYQHEQIALLLSTLLKGVFSLRLIPLKEQDGRVPAYESMLLTPTISRLIRERKIWEIPRYLEEGTIFGMQSFNQSLLNLVKDGKISEEEALEFTDNKDELVLSMKGVKRA